MSTVITDDMRFVLTSYASAASVRDPPPALGVGQLLPGDVLVARGQARDLAAAPGAAHAAETVKLQSRLLVL